MTHVVAGSEGTDKVNWARKHGIHAVSLEWLVACGYMWREADAAGMAVNAETSKTRPADWLNQQQQLCRLPPPDLSKTGR